jgi:hypothetical protein
VVQLTEKFTQPPVGIYVAVERTVPTDKVGVADVQENIIRPRVLRGPESVHRRCRPL